MLEEVNKKYGLLPRIPEHIVWKIVEEEAKNFKETLKHDPKKAEEQIREEIEWLKENKDFLGKAVEAAVDPALEIFSEKLTHKDWTTLRTLLLKGVLLTLQTINETLKEKQRTSPKEQDIR